VKFAIADKVKTFVLVIRKPFSPAIRQSQIDTVTKLTTGKDVLELAEQALEVAGESLQTAETDLGEKAEELKKAQTAHTQAVVVKDLREKDFDTVVDVLK